MNTSDLRGARPSSTNCFGPMIEWATDRAGGRGIREEAARMGASKAAERPGLRQAASAVRWARVLIVLAACCALVLARTAYADGRALNVLGGQEGVDFTYEGGVLTVLGETPLTISMADPGAPPTDDGRKSGSGVFGCVRRTRPRDRRGEFPHVDFWPCRSPERRESACHIRTRLALRRRRRGCRHRRRPLSLIHI